MHKARKIITAIVTSAILGTTVLPVATAHAQQGPRGFYGYERGDDYRDRDFRRWRDRPAETRRRRAARREAARERRRARLARREFFEERPRRLRPRRVQPAPRYVAPDYAAIRKRKRKKRLRKFIAIGAGLLGLAIIAGAASKRHR